MPRRKQFKGICHDILGTFVSRYNDLNGYWALGQYVAYLERRGKHQLQLKLGNEIGVPDNSSAVVAARYYRGAVLRMMNAQAMPEAWLADGAITFSIVASSQAACEIEIVCDLGRTYRSQCTIDVRPHDPDVEWRRKDKFGPSNQKGH